MTPRPKLRELADRAGILPAYTDALEKERRETPDEIREAILAALGRDARTEAACAHELERLATASEGIPRARIDVLPRVARRIEVRLPARWSGTGVRWRVELVEESGRAASREGASDGGRRLLLPRPEPRSTGEHTVRVEVDGPHETERWTQSWFVTPPACPDPVEVIGRERSLGLFASLYSVRGRGSEGVGDLGDLADLLETCAELGGAFVLLSPLQATRNRGAEKSPYSPVTRLFPNPLYARVADVPELGDPEGRALIEAAGLDRLDARSRIRYEEVFARKQALLRHAFARFSRLPPDAPRRRAFDRFARDRGDELRDFATFLALEEHQGPRAAWGPELAGPGARAVAVFRRERAREIDFHRFVQLELDRQLAAAAERGRRAGLPVGPITDLPLGSVPDGYDAWAHPDWFVPGVTLGAPPDPFNPRGQDWGLHPVAPRSFEGEGARGYDRMLRESLRHAGGLRIDHVPGIVRQYWIPAGFPPDRGAYVAFPTREILGLVALAASRRRALVIGEDLGTVPPGLSRRLANCKILSSKVLYFEREADGTFRPASRYAEQALTTANTHDLPTLVGFVRGDDLERRRAAGLFSSDAELRAAREERARDVTRLCRRVGFESDPAREGNLRAFVREVHRFLARTPSALVGLALDDLALETESVNLPGTGADRYPNWTRRMRDSLDELRRDAAMRRELRGLRTESTRNARR